MKDNEVMNRLYELIRPMVEDIGYELYHIEYVKEAGENYLRIYIDSENGITLDDCEKVSRPISEMLDVEDPIPDSFYLEVSSPGVFRFLYNDKHLSRYTGSNVLIKLNSLFNSKKQYQGVLLGYDDNIVKIKNGNEDFAIPRDKIKSINLNGDI